ncbi:hypothetical protein H0H87_004618 [Tephrocybe sp. NHM501043]|nr:hypothetical protein H0H87_004618 [Tephrocybe sp. NHM501043]
MADVSRATSVSRASRQGSTVSRNQSLIKKNIAPHDLHPSDVLIERFVAWKAIVKQLIAYFEATDIENNTAKELTRLGGVIQVPFRSGNQFLGEGGLQVCIRLTFSGFAFSRVFLTEQCLMQDVYYAIRDNTRQVADQHANLGRTIDSSIVQHLQKVRTEIKAHIKNVQNDTGKLATNVAKERELSTRLIAELSSNISTFKNRPMSVTHRTDPYVTNAQVISQLRTQLHAENLLQKSIIIMQQSSADFESGIVRALQSAWATYTEWASRSALAIQSSSASLAGLFSALAPDREWISFAGRADHLLDPETPLRDPTMINYPSKDDPSVHAVHTGYLERKKRFTRAYRESYFVLTPAGFLHSYSTSSPSDPGSLTPVFSLFLPMCTLGPPSAAHASSHKFHIETSKDGSGTTKAGGLHGLKRLTGGGGAAGGHAWAFRARSREDMMEWWNDIRMLCARYLVASESMERSGPVEAAVRAIGYASESDEEEGEEERDEEDEGSSVEEEEHDEHENEGQDYEQAGEEHEHDRELELPGYAKGTGGSGVEIGPNGYAIEKKSALPGSFPEPNVNDTPTQAHPQPDESHPVPKPDVPDDQDANTDDGEAYITRRPSQRQQDKAPEGWAPHSAQPDAAEVSAAAAAGWSSDAGRLGQLASGALSGAGKYAHDGWAMANGYVSHAGDLVRRAADGMVAGTGGIGAHGAGVAIYVKEAVLYLREYGAKALGGAQHVGEAARAHGWVPPVRWVR